MGCGRSSWRRIASTSSSTGRRGGSRWARRSASASRCASTACPVVRSTGWSRATRGGRNASSPSTRASRSGGSRRRPAAERAMRVPIGRLALTILAATGAASADATVHIVAPDGSGDFATIDAAVAAAEDGDRIELLDGTYLGDGNRDIDLRGKSITIRSQSGDPAACVIDCQGEEAEPHRAFVCVAGEDDQTRIEQIGILRGWAEEGGAIYMCAPLRQRTAPRITGCVFAANRAQAGGALYLQYGCDPELQDCAFRDNVASGPDSYGGALYANYSSPQIRGCTFAANRAEGALARGGAGYLQGEGRPLFEGCAFSDNASSDALLEGAAGGGLYIREIEAELHDCFFAGNVSSFQGGGLCIEEGRLTLAGCTFSANSAVRGGGLSGCGGAEIEAAACSFVGNGACEAGGAVACGCSAQLALSACILAGSTAGGAVSCAAQSSCTITLRCSDVWDNAGGNWTGCIADQWDQYGNLLADPCFCADGLHIAYASPCFPDSNSCGVYIGAWEHGCWGCGDVVPARELSWGRLRALFRPR
ncbi:MAG: hypothetical protein GF330_02305 [Candidatus Eisenbacteria bacterium]|nr:hypothetical protein [Candidatus Eisenbacteria bacterium]